MKQKIKYHTIEEVRHMVKIQKILKPYHVPYNKLVMLLAGIIVVASFVIPLALPVPVGFAAALGLLRRYG